ncbi:MAG: hypothetical protein HQ595_01535, partial [Candidatus Omnitrophica bacterium]|nr:hypothetical protein [Candidatus Omnitrophota bacterium]
NKYFREFTRKCEQRYFLLTDQLGFNRSDFSLKAKQIEIFVYQDKQDYLQHADPADTIEISTFYFDKDFFSTTLSHQLSRILFREFIGPQPEVPVWFEQGVAFANEEMSMLKYFAHVKGLINSENYLSVVEMEEKSGEKLIHTRVFSASSASVVIFLLDDYSKDHFVRLCRELRAGNSFYEAMNKVYQIADSEDLNNKFLAYTNKRSFEDIAGREDLGR